MNVGDLLAAKPGEAVEGELLPARRLTAVEARRLTDQIKGHAEILGRLLLRAYEGEAWIALDYSSWREYAMAEFGISQSRAYQLLAQTRVIAAIESGPVSTTVEKLPEAQARELAPLLDQPDKLRDVYAEAVDKTGGKPTAAAIRDIREREPRPEATPVHGPQADAVPQGASASAPNGAASANGSGLRPSPATGAGEVGAASSRPAPVADERPKPPKWDPDERRQHEEDVQRLRDIEAARRYAANIVTDLRTAVVTIVTGCRYGEPGLVTPELIAELRAAIDLLEGEL